MGWSLPKTPGKEDSYCKNVLHVAGEESAYGERGGRQSWLALNKLTLFSRQQGIIKGFLNRVRS